MKNPYSSTLNVQASSNSVLSFSSVHRSNTAPVSRGSGTGICQLNSNFFVILLLCTAQANTLLQKEDKIKEK